MLKFKTHPAFTRKPYAAMIIGATLIMSAQIGPQAMAQSVPVSDFELKKVSSSDIRAGMQAFKKGDYDLAVTYHMRALGSGLSPKRKAAAYSNLCASYGALEDYAQARQACQAALKLSPQMDQAQHNVAIIDQAMGALAKSDSRAPLASKLTDMES